MRGIKFRAFDRICNQMIYSDNRDKSSREVEYSFEISEKGVSCWWQADCDDSFGYPTESSDTLDNIMQYTGLKDKDGVEIYEGDIVRTIYDGNENIYQVVYDLSELDFKATNGKEQYGNNFEYMTRCDEIKVIGNIYENPTLLK